MCSDVSPLYIFMLKVVVNLILELLSVSSLVIYQQCKCYHLNSKKIFISIYITFVEHRPFFIDPNLERESH